MGTCDFLDVIQQKQACQLVVSAGTPVTFSARPEPGATITEPEDAVELPDFPVADPTFVRWTVGACAGAGDVCTFTPTSDFLWVGALFSPLELEIGLDKADGALDSVAVEHADGGVTGLACDVLDFGVSTCHGLFAADSNVVLVDQPADGSPPIVWGAGCDSQAADATHSRCTVDVTNIRTFVSAAFGDPSLFTPPDFPFKIEPHVQVERIGTGSGRVNGSGYDCGSLCSAFPDYQALITLDAHPTRDRTSPGGLASARSLRTARSVQAPPRSCRLGLTPMQAVACRPGPRC